VITETPRSLAISFIRVLMDGYSVYRSRARLIRAFIFAASGKYVCPVSYRGADFRTHPRSAVFLLTSITLPIIVLSE
jgi:hypothetical protein